MSDNFFVATDTEFEHVSNLSSSMSKIVAFAELESPASPTDQRYENYQDDSTIFVCEMVPTEDGPEYKIRRIVHGGVVYAPL